MSVVIMHTRGVTDTFDIRFKNPASQSIVCRIWFMRGFGALLLMGLTVAWAAWTLWLKGNYQAADHTRISAQVAGVVFLGILVWMDMALLCMI